MTTDPIADLLTQIRNAIAVRKEYIELPASNPCEEVCKLLKKRGFIAGFNRFKEKGSPGKMLHIDFLYLEGDLPAIEGLKRLSKPGARFYSSYQDLPISKGGRGFVIVSTSRGVMDSKEARKKHLGGEVWGEVF
jgi:small subunit ribosomal protein S8